MFEYMLPLTTQKNMFLLNLLNQYTLILLVCLPFLPKTHCWQYQYYNFFFNSVIKLLFNDPILGDKRSLFHNDNEISSIKELSSCNRFHIQFSFIKDSSALFLIQKSLLSGTLSIIFCIMEKIMFYKFYII